MLDVREHLGVERRSFIIGTLVVFFVVAITGLLLEIMMSGIPLPTKGSAPTAVLQWQQQAMAHLSWGQQFVIQAVQLAGAVGLFFLNWRFSFLIQRPRAAFAAAVGRFSAARVAWWAVLFVNSMVLFPQIAVTILLAIWGKQEIRRLPPAPPAPEANA